MIYLSHDSVANLIDPVLGVTLLVVGLAASATIDEISRELLGKPLAQVLRRILSARSRKSSTTSVSGRKQNRRRS